MVHSTGDRCSVRKGDREMTLPARGLYVRRRGLRRDVRKLRLTDRGRHCGRSTALQRLSQARDGGRHELETDDSSSGKRRTARTRPTRIYAHTFGRMGRLGGPLGWIAPVGGFHPPVCKRSHFVALRSQLIPPSRSSLRLFYSADLERLRQSGQNAPARPVITGLPDHCRRDESAVIHNSQVGTTS